MFEAGYFMPNRQLFDNFGSVIFLAAVGTISNAIAICATLYYLGQLNFFSIPFSLFEILLFAAPISAVDPVAVIAVFEEIHVNDFLFIHVFGESLFNDSITVVLYIMFLKFIALGENNIHWYHYFAVGGSFFLIAGELFGMSSIFAIVVCGILMKDYIKANVSNETRIFTKQAVKAFAQCTENLAFFLLGITSIIGNLHWDFAFIGFSLACCLCYRIIAIIIQCSILNPFKKQKFCFIEQIILSFSGLRGAIAYGLAASMPDTIKAKPMFLASCMACIFFSVFIQGIAIRPLLNFLKVERKNMEAQTIAEYLNNRVADLTMDGIESVAGISDKNSLRQKFESFNTNYLVPFLTVSKENNPNAILLKRKYQNVFVY
uniref:Cation/H+ exchanger domain-containing protein n=1 Tax=Panagrolaimus sp. PS1159 TaxID=55785 RepID=A0AC35G660_9BILA